MHFTNMHGNRCAETLVVFAKMVLTIIIVITVHGTSSSDNNWISQMEWSIECWYFFFCRNWEFARAHLRRIRLFGETTIYIYFHLFSWYIMSFQVWEMQCKRIRFSLSLLSPHRSASVCHMLAWAMRAWAWAILNRNGGFSLDWQ